MCWGYRLTRAPIQMFFDLTSHAACILASYAPWPIHDPCLCEHGGPRPHQLELPVPGTAAPWPLQPKFTSITARHQQNAGSQSPLELSNTLALSTPDDPIRPQTTGLTNNSSTAWASPAQPASLTSPLYLGNCSARSSGISPLRSLTYLPVQAQRVIERQEWQRKHMTHKDACLRLAPLWDSMWRGKHFWAVGSFLVAAGLCLEHDTTVV